MPLLSLPSHVEDENARECMIKALVDIKELISPRLVEENEDEFESGKERVLEIENEPLSSYLKDDDICE